MSPSARPAVAALLVAGGVFVFLLVQTESYALLGALATVGLLFLVLSLVSGR